MNYDLRSINHSDHRYPTVGDYWEESGIQHVRTSKLSDRRHEFLVLLHELVELELCRNEGIYEPDIMAFDVAFEAKRVPGNVDEPGDDPAAPYRTQHRFAENIERQVALALGVDWNAYNREIEELP